MGVYSELAALSEVNDTLCLQGREPHLALFLNTCLIPKYLLQETELHVWAVLAIHALACFLKAICFIQHNFRVPPALL